mmetsp:Transcript_64282/g.199426  ORF Transcript_64282/g.199426 Transcript_64282/m.199426 type:complete len:383 (-) Transcript_64282:18-1166(-)
MGLVDVVQDAQVEALAAGDAPHLLHQGLVPLLGAGEDPEACAVDERARAATAFGLLRGLPARDQCVALLLAVCQHPVGAGHEAPDRRQEARAHLQLGGVRGVPGPGADEAPTVLGLAVPVLGVVVHLDCVAKQRRLLQLRVLGIDAIVLRRWQVQHLHLLLGVPALRDEAVKVEARLCGHCRARTQEGGRRYSELAGHAGSLALHHALALVVLPATSKDLRVACEVLLGDRATVRGSTPEVMQVAIVRAEVEDAGHLAFGARLQLAPTAIRGESQVHLVGVLTVSSGPRDLHEIGTVREHAVLAAVVGVFPAVLSSDAGLDLGADSVASDWEAYRRLTAGMHPGRRAWALRRGRLRKQGTRRCHGPHHGGARGGHRSSLDQV